jgi:hypothetical protein
MAEFIKKLSEPFPKDKIKQKRSQGGRVMSYISHGLVTERLNEVDPNWSSHVLTEHIYTDQHGRLHCEGVTIALTVNHITRVEAGGPQRQDGFANEIKNAYSDALKRAAMRFGVALGMWESLVDAEYDEDVHPDYTPGEFIAPQRPNPPPTERRTNTPPPTQKTRTEPASRPQQANATGDATEPQIRNLFRLGKKLGWTEDNFHEELFQTYEHTSVKALTRQQASDWIKVLKKAAGEDDEPAPSFGGMAGPALQEPAFLSSAPDLGEPGNDRWS